MEPLVINITQHIKLNKGITPDEAEPILNMEKEAFNKGQKVILDFSNVEMLTTAFLNVVIGNLYEGYTSDQLKNLLSFRNYDIPTSARIAKVIENAKAFYNDNQSYTKIVEEVLNED